MGLIKKTLTRLSGHQTLAFLFIGALSALIVLFFFAVKPSLFTLLDLKAGDAMLRARGTTTAPDSVVIIAVDEKSVNELGRWPWPRKRIAEMVKGLDQASVLAFDMVFSESENTENDKALSLAVKDAGNVVLGYFFREDSTEAPNKTSVLQMQRSKISIIKYLDSDIGDEQGLLEVENFSGVEPNISLIGTGAKGFGTFNIIPGSDGSYRFANLIYSYEGSTYSSLSIEALRVATGNEIILNTAIYGIDSLDIGDYHVPLDSYGALALNFYGPGMTFKHYSAVDVIKGRIPPSVFKDKVVFVGATEKAIFDIRVTPVDPIYPGVEVHATLAGTILENRFLINDSRTMLLTLLLILILPLFLALVISRARHTYISLLIFFGFVIGYAFSIYEALVLYNIVLSLVYPVFSLSLAYLAIESYRNVIVEKKSKFYKKAFSTYVPPQVVSEIVKNPESLKLGGENRNITILFSDIRGFTSLAEAMTPERLVTLLNEYLTPMTRIIFQEKGTLDKYIGDAIMAIFNAPVDLPAHPSKACSAALNMIGRLPGLNSAWLKDGYPPIYIGVGINTGEAIVGNMGADLRFDYTAIGDAVNLSSRLEGMNKVYGTQILVSEFTYAEAKDDFIFRELDLVRVKGKEKPVAIYELMGRIGDQDIAERSEIFLKALIEYRKGKFKTALYSFSALLEKFPEDPPSMFYILRCKNYMENPPPKDWDGIFTSKLK
ncbi:MAG: adenylate/guanylate cyclase domain-containing protein [Deltaproteobacteria bacterium]|nr:adenylate/guanylate cyclase domain-containing protein [Deltaproteobacteria bacterium]